MSEPKRVTIASIADLQFRFNTTATGFDVTIIGADRDGKDVEVTLTGQMAIGAANGVMIAMEPAAQRSAAIMSGAKTSEPKTRVIPEMHRAH